MPYCPRCSSEYREGFFQCADCGVDLVEADLSDSPAPPPEELVTIGSFDSATAAGIAASLLDAQDIECFIQDQEILTANPLLGPMLGGVKVQVRASQAAQAREILAKSRVPAPQVPEEGSLSCPACGSTRACRERISTRAAFLSILLLGFPLLFRSAGWKCMDCGHLWR